MKRKYSEAARDKAARRLLEQASDDDEAVEARDWFDEWATVPRQEEMNNNQGSQHE